MPKKVPIDKTPEDIEPIDETPEDIDDRWHEAFQKYGLERPGEERLITVFRVILTVTSQDYLTKASTHAGPNCEPAEVLASVLEPWGELLAAQARKPLKLTMVHNSRKTAFDPALCHPTYIVTLTTDPHQRRRPHSLLEVTWGSRHWLVATALPRWINIYSCQALVRSICGPVLEEIHEAKLNGGRLSTLLVECHTGSFLQISLTWQSSYFIMEDLQLALSQRLHLVHLPLKCVPDRQRKITVYVAYGPSCYTSISFTFAADSKQWESVLIATGRTALPKWGESDYHFYPVHVSFEEHTTLHDPQHRHFVLADPSLASPSHRVVIVKIGTPAYEWVGACTWPATTSQWELLDLAGRGKQWDVYHNCLPLPTNLDLRTQVRNGDYFALFERLENESRVGYDSLPSSAISPQVSPFGNPPGLPRVAQPVEDSQTCSAGLPIADDCQSVGTPPLPGVFNKRCLTCRWQYKQDTCPRFQMWLLPVSVCLFAMIG